MGETIDAVLTPLITRATFKKAGTGVACAVGQGACMQDAVLDSRPAILHIPSTRPGMLTTAPAPRLQGRALYVKLGDKEVEYNRAFRLILHTKLSA